MPEERRPAVVRFGPFRLDLNARRLYKSNRRIRLQPQPFRLLAFLADRPNQTITRDEMRHALWDAATHVDFEQGTNLCVSQVRRALGDSATDARYLHTVPGVGYRLHMPAPDPDVDVGALHQRRPRRVRDPVPPAPIPALPLRRTVGWSVLWAGAAAIVALTLLGPWRSTSPDRAVPRLVNPVQLTNASGLEDFPAWSPNGQALAYDASEQGGSYAAGNWDIWVATPGGGEPVNRTSDHAGPDRAPTWTPDGGDVAFWSARLGGGYFIVPAFGGTARKLYNVTLAPFGVGPLQWSPDQQRVAFVKYEDRGPVLEVHSSTNGQAERLPLPGWGRYRMNLSWSPAARIVAYLDCDGFGNDLTRLWTLDLDTGQASPVTGGDTNVWSPSWSPDGRQIFFVSNRGGSMDLWAQPVDAAGRPLGSARRLTEGLELRSAALSPDGSKVAYSSGRRVTNIYRVPRFEDRVATWNDAEQLTFDEAWTEMIDISPDGRQLVLSSDRRGMKGLWLMPSGGGEMQRLTSHRSPDRHPRWSRDGRQIVFHSSRAGSSDLWVLPLENGAPRRLTHDDEAQDYGAGWSPDGREIAFWSRRDGEATLWKVSVEAGEVQALATHSADDWMEDWSPDGRWIAFASNRSGDWRIYRMPAEGGPAEALTHGSARSGRWAPDSQWLYFTGWEELEGNIWAVSAGGETERQVTDLRGRRGVLALWALAVSDEHIYFGWEQDRSDIWLADLEWE